MTGDAASGGWNVAFTSVAVMVALAELPVALELLEAVPRWGEVLTAHAVAVAAAAVFAATTALPRNYLELHHAEAGDSADEMALRRHFAARAFWAWALAAGTALFGFAGAASLTVAFLLYLRHARHSRPFEQWYRELFPERGRRIYERIYDELMLTARQRESASDVVPFSDVISFGKRSQKMLAISTMSRHFEPPFAPVLKRALEDPDNSVRIQAATAITNLESRFAERSMRLENRIKRDPAPKQLLELARHLDRFAYSGLLDRERTTRVRARAIECYQRYLAEEPEDLFARIAVGRLLLRAGEVSRSRAWLEATRERHGSSPSLDNWLLEARYADGDFAAVRALARDIAASAGTSGIDVLSDSARLWAGTGTAAGAHGATA